MRCAARLPDTPINILSGGEKRRVALTRLLLSEPDILLLDEPTNHLDAESVAWLEHHLREYKGTVIAVTHDRYFLDNVAGWILELDRGYGIPWKGNYSSWLEQKQERVRLEEKSESKRQKTLERELEWIRMSPKARQSKGQGPRHRLRKTVEPGSRRRAAKNWRSTSPRSAARGCGLRVRGRHKSFDDRLILESFSATVPPGAIIGIVGPNGAGKTTLLKMIIGQEKPDSGSSRSARPSNWPMSTNPHARPGENRLRGDLTAARITRTRQTQDQCARLCVHASTLLGSDQQKKVGILSGGERNRVHLAKTLTEGANVLLLDEPTNDLDVNTLRALEEALEEFAGTALVVSHDRWFLDRICTHLVVFEGDSIAKMYLGNWSDYETMMQDKFGKDLTPHRVKYRILKR